MTVICYETNVFKFEHFIKALCNKMTNNLNGANCKNAKTRDSFKRSIDCCCHVNYHNDHSNKKCRFCLLEYSKKFQRKPKILFCKSLILNVIFALICLKLSQDLSAKFRSLINDNRNNQVRSSTLIAWASWIGEVPTAAELYGDASSEVPSGEGFDDDDEDEELDASATNDYPENDESYEDADDQQESSLQPKWLRAPPFASNKRIKRDIDDVSSWSTPDVMENRIALQQNAGDNDDMDNSQSRVRRRIRDDIDGSFNVDDGNEDAWVHDGVDDIHIDPETRLAANQLNQDQAANSLDAEYEPQSGNQQDSSGNDGSNQGDNNAAASNSVLPTDEDGNPIVNRTRVTTISEVIPTRVRPQDGDAGAESQENNNDDDDNQDSSLIHNQYAFPETYKQQYLPAAHLSTDQIQQLFNVQPEQ